MIEIDPGHIYQLDKLDSIDNSKSILKFVKREGPGYPGNIGRWAGTNIQEVVRALIARLRYLDKQIRDDRNTEAIEHLQNVLLLLELRAAERHGRELYGWSGSIEIENLPPCNTCGHIQCNINH